MVTSARSVRGPYAGTQARQEQIVAAAFEVFSRSGYQGGSMREVAALVGVSHSSLKHHFGSKEDLLVAVLRRRSSVDLPVIRAFTAEGGVLYAAIAMGHYNALQRGIVQLHTLLVAEAGNVDHPARLFEQQRYAALVAEIEAGMLELQRNGQIGATVDALLEARNLSSLVDGVQVQWLLDDRVDMPAQIGAYVDRLAGGPVRRPTQDEVVTIPHDVISRPLAAAGCT